MHSILVAGGAGFIGSQLCQKLLDQQFPVVCIDNFITGDKKNIEPLVSNPLFSFIEHNISNGLSAIVSQLSSIDTIFHLASPASPNKKSKRSYINFPVETLLVNSQGTYHLLEFAKQQNARLLYASSSEIYGDPEFSPQKEDYLGNVSSIGVRSVYDEAKRFGEAITMAYVRKFNVNARIVRIFNTYGPKMQIDDGRVVSNFITQALTNKPITIYGDGSQTRSFCFVSDMIEGLSKVLLSDNTSGEVFNLGNPDERTVRDLATMVKEKTSSQSEIVFEELPQDDPRKRKPDISKVKNTVSWEPQVGIEAGLEKTIEYFKSVL